MTEIKFQKFQMATPIFFLLEWDHYDKKKNDKQRWNGTYSTKTGSAGYTKMNRENNNGVHNFQGAQLNFLMTSYSH